MTPPAGSEGYGGEDERGSVGGENLSAPDTTTAPSGVYSPSVSSEPSADGDLPAEASETSSSDVSSPIPTMARTAARQLESNLLGSGVDEELGRTRAQTRAFNPQAGGLVSMFGPYEGGKIIHGLLAVQEVTRKRGESPQMSRPGSRAGAGFIPCRMLVGVLGRVDGGDEDGVRWVRGGRNLCGSE